MASPDRCSADILGAWHNGSTAQVSKHRQLRSHLKLYRNVSFSNDVTLLCLDGHSVPFNDQSRPVLLGDDFHNWINELRRVWYDMEDASLDIEIAFVAPTPAGSPLGHIHILLYQQILVERCGILVTACDNAYMTICEVSLSQ